MNKSTCYCILQIPVTHVSNMAPRRCPLGEPFDAARLRRFVPRDIDSLVELEDVAELGRLLASTSRPANAAFLSSLVSDADGTSVRANSEEVLDADDAEDMRDLINNSKRDKAVAALAPKLTLAAPLPDDDVREALALAAAAKRPRAAGVARLVAARLAALGARAADDAPASAASYPHGGLVGACVLADRLQAKPELNGRKGRAVAFDADTARYRVVIDGTAYALCANNLSLVDASSDSDDARGGGASATMSYPDAVDTEADALTGTAGATAALLPPVESTVVLLAGPGTVSAAHEIAALISGVPSPGVGPLPPPHGACRAYPWLVHTRYYSATLWLVVKPQGEAAVAGGASDRSLDALANGCGALVSLFTARPGGGGWERMRAAWDADVSHLTEGTEIRVALGLKGEGWVEPSDAEATERTEWALDASVEVLYADLDTERAAAEMRARTGGTPPSMSEMEASQLGWNPMSASPASHRPRWPSAWPSALAWSCPNEPWLPAGNHSSTGECARASPLSGRRRARAACRGPRMQGVARTRAGRRSRRCRGRASPPL